MRWRRAPPGSSSTCTPRPTASWWSATTPRWTAPPPRTGTIASFTLAELRQLDFSYWWIPGADVTPGRPAERLPVPGPGAGRPVVRHRHPARGPRALPRGGPQPRHQADGAGGRPLRGGAGPAPGRVRADRRRDRGLVPRPGHRRLPDASPRRCPPRPAPWPRPRPGGPCRRARTCPTCPAVAFQVPERQGDLVVVDERFVAAAHGAGKAVHVWTVNDAEAMERLLGPRRRRDHLRRAHHAVRRAGVPRALDLERRQWGVAAQVAVGDQGRGVSRGRSSASCRGWPSSSS